VREKGFALLLLPAIVVGLMVISLVAFIALKPKPQTNPDLNKNRGISSLSPTPAAIDNTVAKPLPSSPQQNRIINLGGGKFRTISELCKFSYDFAQLAPDSNTWNFQDYYSSDSRFQMFKNITILHPLNDNPDSAALQISCNDSEGLSLEQTAKDFKVQLNKYQHKIISESNLTLLNRAAVKYNLVTNIGQWNVDYYLFINDGRRYLIEIQAKPYFPDFEPVFNEIIHTLNFQQ